MDEVTYRGELTMSSRGLDVRRCQEWLSLHGFGLKVDGRFGAATRFAVKEFQRKCNLSATGTVNRTTFDELVAPLSRSMEQSGRGGSLRSKILYYSRRHLREKPREIGGQNSGPWVRFYMNGEEGPDWPWCAGFVSCIVEQACEELEVNLPITPSVSCDYLAATAKENGRFIPGSDSSALSTVRPGDVFLSRRTRTDWNHVGIVVRIGEAVMLTIEGNTNDSGDREGYEVCQRIRNFRKKDFISMG